MRYHQVVPARPLRQQYESRYPRAGAAVDGRMVMDHVPNEASIAATLTDYDILPGIREVPMADFGGPRSFFYAKDDFARAHALAVRIRQSNAIAPVIVVVDADGPYILEGAHRMVALQELGATAVPGLIVIDRE